jgi:hypothetical protein
MQSGLLWFDNSPGRELVAKVEDAARRYREKFGAVPNTCYVNQSALERGPFTLPLAVAQGKALRVLPAPNVLPHHFWIGVEDLRESVSAR